MLYQCWKQFLSNFSFCNLLYVKSNATAKQIQHLQLRLGSAHHGLGNDSSLDLASCGLGHDLGEVDLGHC